MKSSKLCLCHRSSVRWWCPSTFFLFWNCGIFTSQKNIYCIYAMGLHWEVESIKIGQIFRSDHQHTGKATRLSCYVYFLCLGALGSRCASCALRWLNARSATRRFATASCGWGRRLGDFLSSETTLHVATKWLEVWWTCFYEICILEALHVNLYIQYACTFIWALYNCHDLILLVAWQHVLCLMYNNLFNLFGWGLISDEQTNKGWPLWMLNGQQMSSWLGVQPWPIMFVTCVPIDIASPV